MSSSLKEELRGHKSEDTEVSLKVPSESSVVTELSLKVSRERSSGAIRDRTQT